MAVGLIIGVECLPDAANFKELLDKKAIKGPGFEYVALELTAGEAANRNALKSYYQAACVKHEWLDGMAYANDLQFSDLFISGKRLVIVEPRTVS